MQTVYKYMLKVEFGPQTIKMPSSRVVIHVGEQEGEIAVWAKVDEESDLCDKKFIIYGTGHQMAENTFHQHVGTVQMSTGLVWHVFEIH